MRVFLRTGGADREFEVESFAPAKDGGVLKLKGIDSLAQANDLAGKELSVPAEAFQTPAKDVFYEFQVIGCSVVTRQGAKVGVVNDVLFIPDNDLLVVAGQGGEIFIPLTRSICIQIDPERKEIVIDPPEGLLDLNEI